jgi:hypothetical protein
MIRKSYLLAVTALAMLIPGASAQATTPYFEYGYGAPQLDLVPQPDRPGRVLLWFSWREKLPSDAPVGSVVNYTLGFRMSYTTYSRSRRCENVRSRIGPQCFWVWRGQHFHDALGRVRTATTGVIDVNDYVIRGQSVFFPVPVPPGSFLGELKVWETTIVHEGSGVSAAKTTAGHVSTIGCFSDNWNSYADSGTIPSYWDCHDGRTFAGPPSKVPVG